MNDKHKPSIIPLRSRSSRLGACLSAALIAGLPLANVTAQDPGRVDKLEKENQDLKKRLDALEGIAKKEGILPSGESNHTIKALSDSTLSGFVSSSYFYDTSDPADGGPNGYLWTPHNSFTLNKVKLTLASRPVEASGEAWDAGYRASFIWGQDAPIVNTGGAGQGLEALREAFVEVNAPIGTGLNIKMGQLISLFNFESGDGGVANPNFSQGNQWFQTGNGPAPGIQLGYAVNDKLDFKVRLANGFRSGMIDANGYKTVLASVGFKPDEKTGLSLIGVAGREGGASDEWLKGVSLIASRQFTDILNFATELDYFHMDLPVGSSDIWSAGAWIWADFTEEVGLALRADYVGDGSGGPMGIGGLGFPAHTGMDLASITLTLNYKPTKSLKIQPEIRYDHSTLNNAFDGEDGRFIIGAGVSYMF